VLLHRARRDAQRSSTGGCAVLAGGAACRGARSGRTGRAARLQPAAPQRGVVLGRACQARRQLRRRLLARRAERARGHAALHPVRGGTTATCRRMLGGEGTRGHAVLWQYRARQSAQALLGA